MQDHGAPNPMWTRGTKVLSRIDWIATPLTHREVDESSWITIVIRIRSDDSSDRQGNAGRGPLERTSGHRSSDLRTDAALRFEQTSVNTKGPRFILFAVCDESPLQAVARVLDVGKRRGDQSCCARFRRYERKPSVAHGLNDGLRTLDEIVINTATRHLYHVIHVAIISNFCLTMGFHPKQHFGLSLQKCQRRYRASSLGANPFHLVRLNCSPRWPESSATVLQKVGNVEAFYFWSLSDSYRVWAAQRHVSLPDLDSASNFDVSIVPPSAACFVLTKSYLIGQVIDNSIPPSGMRLRVTAPSQA
jgi:hypothetical protein